MFNISKNVGIISPFLFALLIILTNSYIVKIWGFQSPSANLQYFFVNALLESLEIWILLLRHCFVRILCLSFNAFIYRLFFRGILKRRFVGIKRCFICLKGRFRRIKLRFVIGWFSSCFVWMQNSCAEGLVLSCLSGFGAFSIGCLQIGLSIMSDRFEQKVPTD